ncbi:MAG TPA: hypothetical protein VMV92_12515 [Streptosporangiaceae bacterium]|nr:hypothetical protein [Streptosporangiaceae bacterium]
MIFEVTVPDEWTPGLTLAMQKLMQQAVRTSCPVITCLRPDVTVEQLQDIYQRIEALVQESGLAA